MTPAGVPATAYLAWATICIVWGTTYFAIRVALDTIPPALVGGLRYAIGGALVVAAAWWRGRAVPPPRDWRGLALLGFLMFCVGNGGVIWAEQWVPTGIAAVVVACTPFWMSGIEALRRDGERLSTRTLAGLVCGFAGIVLLVWPALVAGSQASEAGPRGGSFVLGIVALQLACLGWALGSSYARRHARTADPLVSAGVQMLCGGVLLLAIGTAAGEWPRLSFTPRTLWAEIYLTLAGSIGGYTAYVYALRYLPMSTVALYAYVNPVIAVLIGSLLLAEPLGPRLLGAFALVMIGVVIVGRGTARSSTQRR